MICNCAIKLQLTNFLNHMGHTWDVSSVFCGLPKLQCVVDPRVVSSGTQSSESSVETYGPHGCILGFALLTLRLDVTKILLLHLTVIVREIIDAVIVRVLFF